MDEWNRGIGLWTLVFSGGAGIQPLDSDEPNTIHQTFIKLACDIAT
jgi:hypothetical protein